MDLFFVQGFSFLGFLKNLGFVGYVPLFLHSRYLPVGRMGTGPPGQNTRDGKIQNLIFEEKQKIKNYILFARQACLTGLGQGGTSDISPTLLFGRPI